MSDRDAQEARKRADEARVAQAGERWRARSRRVKLYRRVLPIVILMLAGGALTWTVFRQEGKPLGHALGRIDFGFRLLLVACSAWLAIDAMGDGGVVAHAPWLGIKVALLGLSMMAFATIDPARPVMLLYALLVAFGAINSLQFTAMNTLTLIDLAPEQAGSDNGLLSVVQQLAMSLGVAFAAFALNVSQTLRGTPTLEVADFRYAWFAIAALMAVAAAGSWRLAHDAGAAISSRRT